MIHEVKGCADCCFLGEYDNCGHPKGSNERIDWKYLTPFEKIVGDPYPISCPLKKKEIIIKLAR